LRNEFSIFFEEISPGVGRSLALTLETVDRGRKEGTTVHKRFHVLATKAPESPPGTHFVREAPVSTSSRTNHFFREVVIHGLEKEEEE
jgi:hypothetical protein